MPAKTPARKVAAAKPVPRAKSAIAGFATKNLLDSKRLFYFFHVARLGSLTMAETVLDVAQSAISRQIRQLEAEVGSQLLQRTGRGVTLTEAGELLFRQAEDILQEMASTMEMIDQIKRRPAGGQITIASPPTFSALFMPEVVRRFVEVYPDVRLVAYEGSTGQVYDLLASGQVDMAIVLHAATSQKLALQKVSSEPLMLIVSPRHPLALANTKVVERAQLASLDIVLPVGSHGSRALVEAYAEEGGIHLDPRLRLDSLGMSKAVATDGRFCAVLPQLACAAEIARGELVALPLAPVLKRTLYLASLRDRPQTPHMKALAREIVSVVRSKVSEPQ